MTIPNMLSLFRLCLVPVFAGVYFSDNEFSHVYAVLVYATASFTDVLDGKIARKYNQVSKLGRILDPLGDKVMTFTVLLCITISKVIPVWAIVIFLLKELSMTLGGMILLKKYNDMPPSNYFGKISTVVFFLVCVALMLFNVSDILATVLISFALIVMLLAFVSYIIKYIYLIKQLADNGNKKDNENQ